MIERYQKVDKLRFPPLLVLLIYLGITDTGSLDQDCFSPPN